MQARKKTRSVAVIAACVAAVLLLLSGCSGGKSSPLGLGSMGKGEQAVIQVMYPYDESEFFDKYGTLFVSKFPNIDIKVINTQTLETDGPLSDEELYSYIEKLKPDVLLLTPKQYEQLSMEGRLFNLESMITQDKYDLEGIHPAITTYLREKGGGTLYGLAPEFNSQALMYNKDLFAKYGVAEPTDAMSWEEVLALAKLFPTEGAAEERVYGYGLPDFSQLGDLIYTIGRTHGLQLLGAEKNSFNPTSDGWREAFELVADIAASGSLLVPSQSGDVEIVQYFYEQDPFLSGKLAMKLVSAYEIQFMREAAKEIGDEAMPRWGIVTAPVQPQNRTQSNYFEIESVYAVHADSAQARAAWEFIKYINGEEYAVVKSKTPRFSGLSSRTAYIADVDGVSMEPLYQLSPGNTVEPLEDSSYMYRREVISILDQELREVVAGQQTVEEAINKWKNRAQAHIDEVMLGQ